MNTVSDKKLHTRAFTLVELLVVIATISILASLLLPVLGEARKTARKITCANNLKQLGVYLIEYADSNNGWYPAKTATAYSANWWSQPGYFQSQFYKMSKDYELPYQILFCPDTFIPQRYWRSQYEDWDPIAHAGGFHYLGYAYLARGGGNMAGYPDHWGRHPKRVTDRIAVGIQRTGSHKYSVAPVLAADLHSYGNVPVPLYSTIASSLVNHMSEDEAGVLTSAMRNNGPAGQIYVRPSLGLNRLMQDQSVNWLIRENVETKVRYGAADYGYYWAQGEIIDFYPATSSGP